MNTNSYKLSGFFAIGLAVLFPIYWSFAFSDMSLAAIRADFLTLTGWDLLFIVIGALEVLIYLALSRFWRDQIGGALASTLLVIMASMVAVFHATVLVDVMFALGVGGQHADGIISVALLVALASLFVFTVSAFILAIVLLARFSELPTLMRVFAIGLLLACIFQFTVIFGVFNIFLFPVLMLLLAAHFLRGEHSVEVV